MKPEAISDAACLQCHESIKSKLEAHTHHGAKSDGSRCYNCHMPHSSFGLLRAVRSHQISSPQVKESISLGRPNACSLCHLDRPLAWTAEKLHAWYGQPVPTLSRDDREIAAGAKWLLKGDAGQRALVSWSMGWAPARAASNRDWFSPYLAITLNDPYAAVRFSAWKSLQTLPGFKGFTYNYTADDSETYARAFKAYQRSIELTRDRPGSFPPATLLEPDGHFKRAVYQRLLDERDDRRIYLVE
jgi:hypothetical protein